MELELITDVKDVGLKKEYTDVFGDPISRDLLRDSLRASLEREAALIVKRDALKEEIGKLEERYRNVCKVAYGETPEDWHEAPEQGKD